MSGRLECLHKACQAAITDESIHLHYSVTERGENERQSENVSEMKTVISYRSRGRQELVQTRLRRKGVFEEKGSEFRV